MLDSEDIAVRLSELEGRINLHKALMEQAKESLNERLDGMNEFRREMSQDKVQFVNRTEWDAGQHAIEGKLDTLQGNQYQKLGKDEYVANHSSLEARIEVVQTTARQALGKDFEARVEERFSAVIKRGEFTERMIWMAMGAIGLITFLVHFIPGTNAK